MIHQSACEELHLMLDPEKRLSHFDTRSRHLPLRSKSSKGRDCLSCLVSRSTVSLFWTMLSSAVQLQLTCQSPVVSEHGTSYWPVLLANADTRRAKDASCLDFEVRETIDVSKSASLEYETGSIRCCTFAALASSRFYERPSIAYFDLQKYHYYERHGNLSSRER